MNDSAPGTEALEPNPAQLAIDAVGGVMELARRLNALRDGESDAGQAPRKRPVSYQVIQHWVKTKNIPAQWVLDVEKATIDQQTKRPKVTRHQLRRDLYPPVEEQAA
jgi:hypothetical protein